MSTKLRVQDGESILLSRQTGVNEVVRIYSERKASRTDKQTQHQYYEDCAGCQKKVYYIIAKYFFIDGPRNDTSTTDPMYWYTI